MTWSDTRVVATVASTALTGIACIQQNGAWSNALAFTVPAEDGVTLMPSLLNLMVGDTHAIQALSAAGQPVTGLTWTSSDPAVVSLSSDDPPLLTALAAGHVTITAGTASADVTVSSPTEFPGGLPLGTVLWSHPGDVYGIVPAVPSASGAADVFAFQYDGLVQAIRSDGTTAWTADLGQVYWILPDFQGGLVGSTMDATGLVRYDGATGQPRTLYSSGDTAVTLPTYVVHPDGTVIGLQYDNREGPTQYTAIGFDSSTGAQKFSVPIPATPPGEGFTVSPVGEGFIPGGGWIMVGGDGYIYIPYQIADNTGSSNWPTASLHLVRMNSSGAADDIFLYDVTAYSPDRIPPGFNNIGMITNADTGILITWMDWANTSAHMAITNGASASVLNAPTGPGDTPVQPMLQGQDGSFVGIGWDDTWNAYMVAFDQSGGQRWSVPNYYPLMATANGGVIATTDWVSATIFDQNGNAVGQMAKMPTYSWRGNLYRLGSIDRIAYPPVPSPTIDMALTLCAWLGCNPSGTNCGSPGTSNSFGRTTALRCRRRLAALPSIQTNHSGCPTWQSINVSGCDDKVRGAGGPQEGLRQVSSEC